MTKSNNAKINFKEVLLWLGVALTIVLAFICTYCYEFSSPVKVIIWIGWLLITAFLIFFTSKGKEIFIFSKDAKTELQKVVWPTRQETTQTTSIVMIMVTVTGFVLWGIDSGMMWVIAKLTHLG